MSWLSRWMHHPIAERRNLDELQGDALADEAKRTEIEKMRVEIRAERSWRTKLFLSLVIPIGGAIAFLNTWYSDHAADRKARSEQVYTDAAQQLNSADASVRLNAIQTLNTFISTTTWVSRVSHPLSQPDACGRFDDIRSGQSVGLIIGHLTSEPDPSVLEAIAAVAVAHPCLTVTPLLSADRSAAVQFSRAAGTFGGLYILRQKKAVSLPEGPELDKLRESAIESISDITLRTGSPFEAKDMLNTSFVSRTFLSTKCPFFKLFDRQQRLTLSTDLAAPLLDKPPDIKDVQNSLQSMEAAASILEKVSYVLTTFVEQTAGMNQLQQPGQNKDLYGVAIVVGELDPATIAKLQTLGAYVQHYGVEGNCVKPSGSPPHP